MVLERNEVVLDGKRITWKSLYREIVGDGRIVYTSVLAEDGTVATVPLTTVEFSPMAKRPVWCWSRQPLILMAAHSRGGESRAPVSGSMPWAGTWLSSRSSRSAASTSTASASG